MWYRLIASQEVLHTNRWYGCLLEVELYVSPKGHLDLLPCTRFRQFEEPIDLEKTYPVTINWNKLALKPALDRHCRPTVASFSHGSQSHDHLSKIGYLKHEKLQAEHPGTIMRYMEKIDHGPAGELILQYFIGRYREVDDICKQVFDSKGKSWKKSPKKGAPKPTSRAKTEQKLSKGSHQSQPQKARCVVNGDLDENPKIVHHKTTGRRFSIVSR